MIKSESVANIGKALIAFHKEIKPVVKDGTNPHFKSHYATLDNIITAIEPALEKAGLTFVQFPEGTNHLSTMLIHPESGEWISSEFFMPLAKNDPQGLGSAITYGRRYALGAVLGLATEEDDDANVATAKPKGVVDRDDAPDLTTTSETFKI